MARVAPDRGQPSDWEVATDTACLVVASVACAIFAAVSIRPSLLRRLYALEPVPWHRRIVIAMQHRCRR